MNILIIGGCGYIGTRLRDELKNEYKITVVDEEIYGGEADIQMDYDNLTREYLQEYEVVILLAGQGSVSNSNRLSSVMENNVYKFERLVDKLEKWQIFIYASSSSVYGTYTGVAGEADESVVPNTPYNYYDMSKQMIDMIMSQSELHYYGLRFGTVNGYSSNYRNDLMINSMVNNARRDGYIYMSNPEINRPILGIRDLCEAMRVIIKANEYNNRGIYNLASFNSKVKDIATETAAKLNVFITEPLNVDNKIVNFKLQTKAYNFRLNTDKFRKVFKFEFRDTVSSIIEEIIERWVEIK